MAKNISLLASHMPVRLELFLQFSFSNIVFMFLLYSVLRSINSKKKLKFLPKRLVLPQNNVLVVDEESRGWGIVSFCVPGGGE